MSLLINIARGSITNLTGAEFRLYLSLRYTEEVVRHEREVLYGGVSLKASHSIISRLSLSDARKNLHGSTDAFIKRGEQGLLATGTVELIEVHGNGPTERIYLLGYIFGVHKQYLIDQDAIERDWLLDTTPIVIKRNQYIWGERQDVAIPLEVISQAIKREKARQFKGVVFEVGIPENKKRKEAKPLLKKKDKITQEKKERAYHDWQLHQGAYIYRPAGEDFRVLPYYDIYFSDGLSPKAWQEALDKELGKMKKEMEVNKK